MLLHDLYFATLTSVIGETVATWTLTVGLLYTEHSRVQCMLVDAGLFVVIQQRSCTDFYQISFVALDVS